MRMSDKSNKAVQLSLLDDAPARLAGLNQLIKAAMNRAAGECGLSRDQILDRMNELADACGNRLGSGNTKSLSLATLEKWLNPAEREHMPSALAIVVFCSATGSVAALEVQAKACGGRIISEAQSKLLRKAELEEQIKRLTREKRRIEVDL